MTTYLKRWESSKDGHLLEAMGVSNDRHLEEAMGNQKNYTLT